jgi:hypothetical protein
MWASNFYGFWDYWELYHKATFDGENRIIIINDDVTALDIKIDVYSDWKEWVDLENNGKYLAALRTIGGDPTIDIQTAGDIYFTINGWRVAVDLTTARITGTLFSDDYESAWIDKASYVSDGSIVPVFPALASSLVTGIDSSGFPTTTAIRTELTPELSLIDASVSSRATQTSVTNVESKVDAVDILVNNIDTNITSVDGKVDAIQLDITNILTVVDDIIKYHANRSFIDKDAFTLTIYESNGITPFKIYDLKDELGVASITKIFERIPQ